nr:type II toxin-antitoxin system PemK/MazF family toxin [Cutibacterium sp.]
MHKRSQVMVDKIMTVRRDKIGQIIGRIDTTTLTTIERCLAVFLGIAK